MIKDNIKYEKIIKEYVSITNNEAYYNSFNKRVLKSINDKIIGNSQREDFLPYLENILISESNLNVFDIGAGSGEIISYIKNHLKNKNITFNLEEPNDILLEIYKNKLINMNININKIYREPIQALYLKKTYLRTLI